MSRLDPPQVLIEASALAAIADEGHEQHSATTAAYAELVRAYRAEQALLVAVSTQLHRPWGRRRGRFAPVDLLHVGGQHRRAAARMHTDPHDPEFALTLVMCQRHGVRRMLTLDERFAEYDFDLVALPGGDG